MYKRQDGELLISTSEILGEASADFHSPSVFAYDLRGQFATPLATRIDEPVSCLASEPPPPSTSPHAHLGGRVFLGTTYGGILIASLAVAGSGGGGGRGGGGDTRQEEKDDEDEGKDDDECEPYSLVLQGTQAKVDGHEAPITSLFYCSARSILCLSLIHI